jgi:hypothetical protein
MTDEGEAIAKAYLKHRAMERTRSYLERGRRFEGLAEGKLNEGWASSFIALCADDDQTRATDLHDLSAEIGLRGLEEPVHLVKHAMDRVVEHATRVAEEDRERIESQISAFVDEWKAPKN